jgi:diadenosine tetraphosphate (Ap4A) HIT family hydrolase
LVIPKHHGAKLTDIPDDSLVEILPVVKKLIIATGATDYNILQNNGRIAHQAVDHVCALPFLWGFYLWSSGSGKTGELAL